MKRPIPVFINSKLAFYIYPHDIDWLLEHYPDADIDSRHAIYIEENNNART